MSEQLNPCPFCGSESVSFTPDEEQHNELSTVTGFIWCHGCGFSSDSFISERIAAEKWNRRTPEIVKCGECRHKYKGHCSYGPMAAEVVSDDFGCTEGQRRESEEANGM